MKAVAVYPSRREIVLIDHPEPQVRKPVEAKVRLLEIGVCGTDKEICSFHYGTPPSGDEHLVIGHEALGIVEQIGSNVTELKVGDLVVLTVRRPCLHPECLACQQGRQDFCYSGDFEERGIKRRHGYMTEYVVDEARYMVRVPAHLRDVAILIEPLTIAEKALIQVWQVQQRLPWACPVGEHGGAGSCHTALILGAGPVGLLGAMAFHAAGFKTFVYSREDETSEKAELVRSFGAEFVSSSVTPVGSIAERAGAIDVVYEATGASSLSFNVLQHVGANAIFVFTGVPGRKAPVEVDTDLLMRNMVLQNQVVLGTVNAGIDAFHAAVRDLEVFMERWPHATRKLITGRYPIEQFREPLLSQVGIKNVITFN